jgi:hypothetical protein
MEISAKQYKLIFWSIISFILISAIFKWIDYLIENKYVVECFTGGPVSEDIGGSTSHTVNLPLTTSYSCQNFCGPTARCAITGQQCFTDIDCPGCQPPIPSVTKSNNNVPGDNDAGKLTLGVTPQYSSLTSGYGTQEKRITKNMYSKPAMPNFGVNTWSHEFNEGKKLFDERYKPSRVKFMPNYPERYSLSGEFIEDGPFPSNAPL